MAVKFLDYSGLSYFWGKIKAIFAPIDSPFFTGYPKVPTPPNHHTGSSGSDSIKEIVNIELLREAVYLNVIGTQPTITNGTVTINLSTYQNDNLYFCVWVSSNLQTLTVNFVVPTATVSTWRSRKVCVLIVNDSTTNDLTLAFSGISEIIIPADPIVVPKTTNSNAISAVEICLWVMIGNQNVLTASQPLTWTW